MIIITIIGEGSLTIHSVFSTDTLSLSYTSSSRLLVFICLPNVGGCIENAENRKRKYLKPDTASSYIAFLCEWDWSGCWCSLSVLPELLLVTSHSSVSETDLVAGALLAFCQSCRNSCYVFGKWNRHRLGTPLEREGRAATPGRAESGGTVQGGRLSSSRNNAYLNQHTPCWVITGIFSIVI
jgi:hypothetical protein